MTNIVTENVKVNMRNIVMENVKVRNIVIENVRVNVTNIAMESVIESAIESAIRNVIAIEIVTGSVIVAIFTNASVTKVMNVTVKESGWKSYERTRIYVGSLKNTK